MKKANNNYFKSGFTLVELIVVIVILAILSTIAFLSFSSQSASARDSTRLADMSNISKGLSVFYAVSGKYPTPENPIAIIASGAPIGLQGYAGSSVLNMIKLSNGGKDPLDTTTYYTFSTNTAQNKYQILGFLEDGNNSALSLSPDFAKFGFNGVNADPASYSGRYAVTKGDTLGILLQSGSLVPAQIARVDIDITNAASNPNIVAIMTTVNGTVSNDKIPSKLYYNFTKKILAKNDFNFDGNPNIIFRNLTTGQNLIWFMSGATKLGESEILASPAMNAATINDSNWQIKGVGDFNSDGKPDVVWRFQTSGQILIWNMDGAARTSLSYVGTNSDLNSDIYGIADFNKDGNLDIFWRNDTTGENKVWYMNGINKIGEASIRNFGPGSTWHIKCAADFNKDGNSDLLWRNDANGQNVVWYLDGVNVYSTAGVTALNDSNLQIYGCSDFNKDGNPDLLWHNNSSGDNMVWFMSGATQIGSGTVGNVGNINYSMPTQ